MFSGKVNHTVLNKVLRHLVILLAHELEVEGSTIADLIIDVIQTPREKDLDTALHIRVLLADTEFGKRCDRGGTNDSILQNDAVVNIANILGWLGCLGTLETDQVQDTNSQLGKLAVLNELAQVGKCFFLGVGHELDQVEHALNHGALKLVAALVAQDAAEEGKHTSLLAGEL